ncbi:hypothetical protein GU700_08495 [Methylobacterium sp. NI91]|nr:MULTISPECIES: hypothetical protein [unclassified Methylobacterium]QIJ74613.1 hypothetical protein CLZ_08495 [Methylobacterium sp. CLZ]QIJ79518.1 hypothetical protein GU700_08495 [Methylobacterium sp. NI91]
MEDRLRYLNQMLKPTPGRNIDLIRVMRAQFNTYGESAEEADLRAQMWAIAVADLPDWAVQSALVRFVQGTAPGRWDRQRGPTSAEFAPFAKTLMREFVAEAVKLERILSAQVLRHRLPTQAERDAAVRAAAAFKAEVAAAEPREAVASNYP